MKAFLHAPVGLCRDRRLSAVSRERSVVSRSLQVVQAMVCRPLSALSGRKSANHQPGLRNPLTAGGQPVSDSCAPAYSRRLQTMSRLKPTQYLKTEKSALGCRPPSAISREQSAYGRSLEGLKPKTQYLRPERSALGCRPQPAVSRERSVVSRSLQVVQAMVCRPLSAFRYEQSAYSLQGLKPKTQHLKPERSALGCRLLSVIGRERSAYSGRLQGLIPKTRHLKPNTQYLIPFIIFIFVSCDAAMAQESLPAPAAEAVVEITPLEVGDRVPEEIWQTPFQVVKYKEEPKTIRLEEYRGKTIIIDFWATWCASCILAMPKMHGLAEAFPNEVVLVNVTDEDERLISNFLKVTGSPQVRELENEFSTIVSGQALKKLIPHRTLPHIAIINSDGILEQITKPNIINREVVSKLVNNEKYHLPMYQASLDTTILSHTHAGLKQYKPTYYTTVTGYMEGFMFPWGEKVEEVAHGFYVNSPILKLFQKALSPKFNMMFPSRRLMVMDDPGKVDFFHERNKNYRDREYSYSYEYVLPPHWDKAQILQRMYDDLSGFTEFDATIIERDVSCLVIRTGKNPPQETKNKGDRPKAVIAGILKGATAENLGLSETGARNYVRATKINSVARILNDLKEGSVPFVIDETGIDYPIDLDLPDDLTDVNALKTTFARQGLELVPEIRNMEMFVMADRPIDREAWSKAPIELTKFGYVLKEGYSYE